MTLFANGVTLEVPDFYAGYSEREVSIKKSRKGICIDGMDFGSYEGAIRYLMNDGMTAREAADYIAREAR